MNTPSRRCTAVSLLGTALVLTSCGFFPTSEEPVVPSPRVAAVESFAVYFSDPWRDTLATFDLVVLDPDNRSVPEVQQLRERGVRPVAYVNLGEAESYRYFFDAVDPDWLLGANPHWANHFYVDARRRGWQRLLLDTVIPNIRAKEFEGVFLDMVDTALPSLYPETEPGMIALIEEIRRAYPDWILIMNNGLFLVDDVHRRLDALVVENVFTRYDFEQGTYTRTPVSVRSPLVHRLQAFRGRYGLRAFLLNYADAYDSPHRTHAVHCAREAGFLTFVSTIELDTVFAPAPVH